MQKTITTSITNDDKILMLKEQIKAKKEALVDVKLFRPLTNCSLKMDDGTTYNLRTLNKDRAMDLLVKLNIIMLSVKDLKLEAEYKINGYLLTDWISDIHAKMEELVQRDKMQELVKLEKKLSGMLSDDKQVELELDNIADLLKD